jgi:sialate O-acetylesterase
LFRYVSPPCHFEFEVIFADTNSLKMFVANLFQNSRGKTILAVTSLLVIFTVYAHCTTYAQTGPPVNGMGPLVEEDMQFAARQYKVLMQHVPADSMPKTYDPRTGRSVSSDVGWWCSGFYPGTLLNIYNYTRDTVIRNEAVKKLGILEKEKYFTGSHDLGFMMFCSFGTALRVLNDPAYKQVVFTSARSLSTRFRPSAGVIQSWPSSPQFECPVIIDNMMNLELLEWVSRNGGDPRFGRIAETHANTTMRNHFRPDYSSYHVVDYNPVTGNVNAKRTRQGYADGSAWSRGQGWGLYGFTMMYRFTKEAKYLSQARHIAGFILHNPRLPGDMIPYWDFDAPDIPHALRDVSAGAICASALLELGQYVSGEERRAYVSAAEKILRSLSSDKYRAKPGTNGGFLLMHSVGGLPFNSEVDVPLMYADYYFIEALTRYKQWYAQGQLKLPRLISDGMVLQRDRKINVWGWDRAGENVSVTFNRRTYHTRAGADQKWRVELPPTAYGGPYKMVIRGSGKITVNDILIGDVWICSGQSNMEFLMTRVKEKYAPEIAGSANNRIRQFFVGHAWDFNKADDVKSPDGWQPATPANVLKFTAVGYFFAKSIYEKYKVPLGLISTSVGGTPAEAWTSGEGLKAFPGYLKEAGEYRADPAKVQEIRNKDTTHALSRMPTVLFNSMIAPLIPYTIKGVVWYQGEQNTGRAYEYRTLFPALINDWRSWWGQGDFPFLYVQLAGLGAPVQEPSEDGWASLREAQTMALALPNTGMAVIHDIGEWDNIHPSDKKDVGERLSLAAQKIAYGDDKIVYSGPTYESMKMENGKIYISFKNTGGGLAAGGSGELKYFAIAGADRKFVWASARIEGDKVVVWSDQVANPVSVRYAWARNPQGANLYNKEGLPASLFRTDDWDSKKGDR